MNPGREVVGRRVLLGLAAAALAGVAAGYVCGAVVTAKEAPLLVRTGAAPAACLDALDAADRLAAESSRALLSAGDVIGQVPLLVDALVAEDLDALDAVIARVELSNAEQAALDVGPLTEQYEAARDQCRQTRPIGRLS